MVENGKYWKFWIKFCKANARGMVKLKRIIVSVFNFKQILSVLCNKSMEDQIKLQNVCTIFFATTSKIKL